MVQIGGRNAILYSEHDLSILVRVLPPSLAWRLMASQGKKFHQLQQRWLIIGLMLFLCLFVSNQ